MIPKYCLVHLEFFSETIAEQSCSYNLYDKADNLPDNPYLEVISNRHI